MTNSSDVEIYDVTPNLRVRLQYDENPSNPRTEYAATGALTVNGSRNEVTPVYDFPGDLHRAVDSLMTTARIARWARIFHDVTIDVLEGTIWWTDPDFMRENHPTLAPGSTEYVALERHVIDLDQKIYLRWAAGYVYGVIVERRQVYTKTVDGVITNPDHTLTVWEEEDAIWGVYFNDDYPTSTEALAFARHDMGADDIPAPATV